jgi:hypothetical protein
MDRWRGVVTPFVSRAALSTTIMLGAAGCGGVLVESTTAARSWSIGEVEVIVETPDGFRSAEGTPIVDDAEWSGGLHVNERWLVDDEGTLATFSVQDRPEAGSVLLDHPYSGEQTAGGLVWRYWNCADDAPGDHEPNSALALSDGLLLTVTGTPEAMRSLIDAIALSS